MIQGVKKLTNIKDIIKVSKRKVSWFQNSKVTFQKHKIKVSKGQDQGRKDLGLGRIREFSCKDKSRIQEDF